MASYNYEEQGGYKFLVYKTNLEDQIDTVVVGQLTDTASIINGVLPVSQIEKDGRVEFQVNITGKTSLEDIFTNPVSPKMLLGIYKQIAGILKEAEEYMLETDVFVLDNKYIYMSAEDEKVYLVALPVLHKTQEPETYLKNLLIQDFDQTEDNRIITEIMSVFKSMPSFSLDEFLSRIEAISVNDNRAKNVIKDKTIPSAKDQHEEPSPEQRAEDNLESRGSTRAQEVVYGNTRKVQSGEESGNRVPVTEKNTESKAEPESEPEKKGFFGSLFGKKEKKEKKEKNKKEKKKEPVSGKSSSAHSYAIPGKDDEYVNKSTKEINASDSNNGIRAQRVNVSNVYRNQQRDFGHTQIFEEENEIKQGMGSRNLSLEETALEETSLEETALEETSLEETCIEDLEEGKEQTVIILKLQDGRGCKVPETLKLKLIDGYVTIGRYDKTGKACSDFNFDYSLTFISREHIKIVETENGFEIIDLNSTNGTLLNGRQLTAETNCKLEVGDSIELSRKTKLKYIFADYGRE